MSTALVVIPTYNERGTLGSVVERVLAVAQVDVLVVDDGSPDGTGDIADALAGGSERVTVVHRERKSGLGSAYRIGLGRGLELGYDVLVEMDADLSHLPEQLPALLEATGSADLVVGSRYVDGGEVANWPWYRRALSKGGNRYVQAVTGIPVRDATSGFRAYRREVLEEIDLGNLRSEGYSFQLETALRTWWDGFRIAEVPIRFVERSHGASKISRAIVFEALWRVLVWGTTHRRGSTRPHPRSVTVRS